MLLVRSVRLRWMILNGFREFGLEMERTEKNETWSSGGKIAMDLNFCFGGQR